MITENIEEDVKKFFDTLNRDRSTVRTSNDEPTPMKCVDEILSKVPDELWSRNNLKILDPCCGNGNFSASAYFKIKLDPTCILENVLYFNDVNTERLENVKKVFGGEKYRLNISCQDFTLVQFETKFDLIMANPPYAKLMNDGSRASKNHNLIKIFLEKSLELLKPNGYLAFLTPDNWMSFADRNTIIEKLTALQFIHLDIHTAKKHFPKIGSSFTWYVIQNCQGSRPFPVSGMWKGADYTSIVPSAPRKYIPLYYTDTIARILSKTIDNSGPKFKVETSSDLHKYTKKDLITSTQDAEHPWRLIHTPTQTVWASRPHKWQEGWKVFISTTDKYGTTVDNCGMTQSIAFIRCKTEDEARKTKEVLDHPLYAFINNICRWGNFNNIRILQRFPVPVGDPFEYFGLEPGEVAICTGDQRWN
jgi:SAM-dependent methyltransferase